MDFQHESWFGFVVFVVGVFFLNTVWFVHDSRHQQPQNIKSIPGAAARKNIKNTASLQAAHCVTFKKRLGVKTHLLEKAKWNTNPSSSRN